MGSNEEVIIKFVAVIERDVLVGRLGAPNFGWGIDDVGCSDRKWSENVVKMIEWGTGIGYGK